jgi:hypothetical protein
MSLKIPKSESFGSQWNDAVQTLMGVYRFNCARADGSQADGVITG